MGKEAERGADGARYDDRLKELNELKHALWEVIKEYDVVLTLVAFATLWESAHRSMEGASRDAVRDIAEELMRRLKD